MNYIILKQARLGPEHKPTGRTRHYMGAAELPPAAVLKIVQYPTDAGYYLLYFDGEGNEMTDTFHETLEGALAQAEFEYGVKPHEWQTVHD